MMAIKTTRPRGFASYNPRGEARTILAGVEAVLAQYAAYLPLTLRQVFYRLVVMAVIGKTEKEYKRLGEILNRARRGDLISFDAIRDDGVVERRPATYSRIDDVLTTFVNHIELLQIERQAGQERELRVWCEAAGMVPQLERVAAPYGIAVMSSGGFDSVTIKHNVGKRLAEGGPLTVLHLGDFDPSGVHIFSSLAEDVTAFAEAYGGDVEFERIAVTPAQVEEYQLPTAPPKPTDNRRFSGNSTTQCEAFDPATLAVILQVAIDQRFDAEAYSRALSREQEIKAELRGRLSA